MALGKSVNVYVMLKINKTDVEPGYLKKTKNKGDSNSPAKQRESTMGNGSLGVEIGPQYLNSLLLEFRGKQMRTRGIRGAVRQYKNTKNIRLRLKIYFGKQCKQQRAETCMKAT